MVCDGVREEARGKLTLLGFLGICPYAEVGLSNLDQPSSLFFMVTGGRGEGQYQASFAVADEADGKIIAETTQAPFVCQPDLRVVAGVQLVMAFRHQGGFSLRFSLDGELKFVGHFQVKQT